MSSEFAWVDIDEDTQRKMLDLVAQFKSQDTIDELGLGKIRNAFSDYFFPGTSTIQTRARYFLFIPWIYQAIDKYYKDRIAERVNKSEFQLISSLINGNPKNTKGLIGSQAKSTLKRLPSSVYWRGLYIWGIRKGDQSQESFCRQLRYFLSNPKRKAECDQEDESIIDDIKHMWATGLPPRPANFPGNPISIRLEKEEAEFLRDRLRNTHPEALLTVIIDNPKFDSTEDLWANATGLKLNTELQVALADSRQIYDLMYGASLVYNFMLADKQGAKELKSAFHKDLNSWVSETQKKSVAHQTWNKQKKDFWVTRPFDGVTVDLNTKLFVSQWIELALKGLTSSELLIKAAPLIQAREKRIKGARARLNNADYLQMWSGDSSTGRLNYRWDIASRLISDIQEGLSNA